MNTNNAAGCAHAEQNIMRTRCPLRLAANVAASPMMLQLHCVQPNNALSGAQIEKENFVGKRPGGKVQGRGSLEVLIWILSPLLLLLRDRKSPRSRPKRSPVHNRQMSMRSLFNSVFFTVQ